VSQLSVPIDRFNIVWIIQPKGLLENSPPRMRDDTWRMMTRFVQGTFELIQGACKDLLRLELSVLMADGPTDWDGLGRRFASLKINLTHGLGSGKGVLMVDQQEFEDGAEAGGRPSQADAASLIGRLASLLENNRREPFLSLLDELMMRQDDANLEKIYYMAASVLLSFHTREMRLTDTGERWDVGRLIRPDLRQAPSEACRYLRCCGESIFAFRERTRGESEDELMAKVKQYIADHLSDELSLTGIAEHVGHNSSYLSRLFKQKNGIGIAEHITDCRIRLAQEMLSDPKQRIQDIASFAGFASVQYFYRVFKKVAGMTPQEWRDGSSPGRQ
jgi:two-component system response regulator YesN